MSPSGARKVPSRLSRRRGSGFYLFCFPGVSPLALELDPFRVGSDAANGDQDGAGVSIMP